jgi:cell wall-associated protease
MIKIALAVAVSVSGFITTAAQKSIKEPSPNGWHMKDKATDGLYGVSADKAYNFLKSKNLKSKTVLVAVIDSGIDTLHEDLKPILWRNPKEIAGNGVDDDKNGYVDDIYGWNFLGGRDGRNVKEDSYEGARVYHSLKTKYQGKEAEDIDAIDKAEYEMWQKAKAKVMGEDSETALDIVFLRKAYKNLLESDSILKIGLAKEIYTGVELESYIPKDSDTRKARTGMLGLMKANGSVDITNKEFMEGFAEFLNSEEKKEAAKNKAPENYRALITGDDETNINDRNYGNGDVMAGTSMHGTHCSGIIAAVRNNGKGIDGIADNVRIMMLRAVPDGDEHDKDIALAIRYAVDNGAQIISMSFGKDFSPQKQWVDDAFKYAESKNVLIVHAAGNDAKNVDTQDNFPSPIYINGKGRAANVITVGASGDPRNGGITASFSNYGKNEVDVFAPGVKIYSTIPGGNTYGNQSGTSMACPLVAGIAALTLSYFPDLTAKQLKQLIEKSAQQPDYKVTKPGTDEMVNMSDISKTGGIANAYETVKAAAALKSDKKKAVKEVLPKPKLVKKRKG